VSDRLRVLIVEDVPSDAELVERALRRGGLSFTSRVVQDRAAYLAALDAERPHIVLSDFAMPAFNGLHALRLLLRRCPEVPLIVVTGSIDEGTAVECIKAGAADYVLKDHLERLAPAVRAALERRLLVQAGRDAERRMAHAQERAQATIDALTSHICVTDEDGRIVAVNRAWREFAVAHGGESEQVLEGASYLEACDRATGEGADDAHLFAEGVRDLLGGRRDEVELEYACPTPQGGRWFVARATSFLTQGARHAVVAHEDVTARKRQESVLLKTEQQLMLAQKMEAIGRLAGGVAHDFNNILSVIRGQTERALRAIGSRDPTRGRLEKILWSADRAARLTCQLLAFGRQQVLEPRVLRLDAVVDEAKEMLERTIGEDIELTVGSPVKLGHVKADPGQIVQVLLNLAVNARDAMPRGGQLIVEFADVVLDKSYARRHPPCVPGAYVLMAISDTGCGMDEGTQSHVFEPFFTTKPEGKGTGLGLATVYGIVKQSGGFIWVYSEPGHGTAFKVYLPRVSEEVDLPCGPGQADASRPAASRSARLLVVEDDASVRALMAEVLAEEGYGVTTAGTPAEALALLEAGADPVDLLLTDVILPGMSGRTLATRMAAVRPVRVLYVSGYAGEAVVRQGGLSRDDHFLQKPFSEADLLRRVADTLEGPAPAHVQAS
jgi:two-component system cell cycle sensor histidine kinase/response regulator CckA